MSQVMAAYVLLGSGQFALAWAGVSGLVVAALFQLLGGLALVGFSLARGHSLMALVRQPTVWISAALLGIMNALTASALTLAQLTTVAVIIQLTPLFGLLLAPLFGERPSRGAWVALVLGVAGGALAVGLHSGDQLVGALLALGSCLAGALWMHHNARSARQDHILAPLFVGVMMSLAGLLLLPAFLFQSLPDAAWRGVLLAAVCYALGNSLQYAGTRTVPAYMALLLRPVLTATAVLWGLLALGNPLTWQLVGGALIVFSCLLVARDKARSATSP